VEIKEGIAVTAEKDRVKLDIFKTGISEEEQTLLKLQGKYSADQ